MKSKWKFWSNTKNETKTQKLLDQLSKLIPSEINDKKIEVYHKGGFVVSFVISHNNENWNDFIIEIISYGQEIGYSWILYGDINTECGGWSDESKISGIDSISWSCSRE